MSTSPRPAPRTTRRPTEASGVGERLRRVDWDAVAAALDASGHARLPALLTPSETSAVAELWHRPQRFRSVIDMSRHRFGVGEYRYFAEPLPRLVASLRTAFYARLAPIAEREATRLGRPTRYPRRLTAYREQCRAAGQTKPTPLLLRYEAGGYNRLHRDLYGGEVFPLQVVIGLSRPRVDYAGGELLLVENHPRQQSIGRVVELEQGDAVVFFVRDRSVEGANGPRRVDVRHGVSALSRGERFALGLIFHDAR